MSHCRPSQALQVVEDLHHLGEMGSSPEQGSCVRGCSAAILPGQRRELLEHKIPQGLLPTLHPRPRALGEMGYQMEHTRQPAEQEWSMELKVFRALQTANRLRCPEWRTGGSRNLWVPNTLQAPCAEAGTEGGESDSPEWTPHVLPPSAVVVPHTLPLTSPPPEVTWG